VTEGAADSIGRPLAGTLFVVATPIGNLQDLSPRAASVLREAQVLLVEDTRHTQQLLVASGIVRPRGSIESLHEHNERGRVAGLIERLERGASMALVSDAGTPLVSDPGALLAMEAARAGIRIVAVPGPCAAIAALSIVALPSARFAFEGFLPAKSAMRRRALAALVRERRTLVFYEAPHRLAASLADLAAVLGQAREAGVAREMTKKFETVYRGTLAVLAQRAAREPEMSRGEIVIVVHGALEPADESAADSAAEKVLRALLEELPLSQAARLAARITGCGRGELYELALAITKTAPQ